MTIPNILTCIRVLLIPVFLVLAYQPSPKCAIWALVVDIVACCTDFVDGYLARKWHQITDFGKFMDPVADKILVLAALMIFVEQGTVPGWAAVIILGREFIVSSLRMVAAASGKVIAANWWGKAKTCVTMITWILLLLRLDPIMLGSISLQSLLIWVTVAITAISGITYITQNKAVILDGLTQKGK